MSEILAKDKATICTEVTVGLNNFIVLELSGMIPTVCSGLLRSDRSSIRGVYRFALLKS